MQPNCTDVCECVMERLLALGLQMDDDEDHTDVLAALAKVTFVVEPLYALSIHHEHGVNFYICTTEEKANELLYDYVSGWWKFELDDLPMPEDRDEAIRMYFDKIEDEYFDIGKAELDKERPMLER